MSSSLNISLDVSDLNQLHREIVVMSIGNMFAKPIQNNTLNRSTLVKGLNNMIVHKEIENYFCFTELVLNNLVIHF